MKKQQYASIRLYVRIREGSMIFTTYLDLGGEACDLFLERLTPSTVKALFIQDEAELLTYWWEEIPLVD